MTLHSIFMNTKHFICLLIYHHITVYNVPTFTSRLDEVDFDSNNEVSFCFSFSLSF